MAASWHFGWKTSCVNQVLSWETVAAQLSELPLELSELRSFFSGLRGSFWATYVSVEGSAVNRVFAVSDVLGVIPMWMALGPVDRDPFILLSCYWPSTEVPLKSLKADLKWRQACPRLMHCWWPTGKLEASNPDSFFGLHGKMKTESGKDIDEGQMTIQLREALIQAVRRCIAGEEHVGLLFSGGLDSGLLAWLFTEELASEARCSCYTVGFHMDDKKIKNKQLEAVFTPVGKTVWDDRYIQV